MYSMMPWMAQYGSMGGPMQGAQPGQQGMPGGLYFAPSNGSLVIYHANNTQADRTFVLAVLG